ncbi:IS701 family transposase [Chloroflexi bacterium TSY]|nr:IS701 family transposase [Chloroflexi bacterium TSY]
MYAPLQSFVGQSRWSGEAMLAEHTRQTGELLGDANGVLLLDGSDIPKQGEESVGVKRQRCGELGKIANCQAGVFLGYNSSHGYTLLNCRLYIPQEWFSDEYAEKRYKTGLPTDLTFQTKNELAWSMIEQTHALGALPIRWITMDEAFGKDTHLLDCIDGQTAYSYFAEVPKETRVWTSSPRPICPHHLDAGASSSSASGLVNLRLSPLLNSLTPSRSMSGNSMFSKRAPRASSLLPLLVAALSLSAMGSPVLLSGSSSAAIPIALCNTFSPMHPLETSLDDFATVSALRWPIETIFEQAKQFLGLNEYETRSWLGWHHHMTLVILAFGFLARSQFFLKYDAPALTLPQVVELLHAVLPKPVLTLAETIERLRYKQRRLASAKRSHYLVQKSNIIEPLLDAQ